jgi:heterotetrameric sarcosine oxidase delta subunit
MLSICCPWCDLRDETEFHCGGEAHLVRPHHPETLSDEAWAAYLFTRTNLKGLCRERWVHRHGCRRWFNVLRDTVTNEIVAVYKIDEPLVATGEAAAV